MKASFYTLGCKLNQAETESLGLDFINQGFKIVKENADVCIVNSCVVTQKAEKETRQTLRLARRQNPKALLVATGCFLKKDVKEVDLWIKRSLLSLIIPSCPIQTWSSEDRPIRTRSFIKIQEGCDNFCSFCIVPYLRGKPRSRPAKEIIQEMKEKEEMGYKEIVLAGTNIGKYKSLVWLIKKILKETNIPRIRLSSLWPTAVTNELLELFKNKRLCPHLHLSLQNGSDKILKKMGRDYTTKQCKNIISRIRKKISDINISADIIVGFPGETEEDFKKTYQFCKSIGFLKLHVFRYSPRPGTRAQQFSQQVSFQTKKKRATMLRKLSDQMGQKIKKKFIGQMRPVLFESLVGNFWQGFTDNYIRVYLQSREDLRNKIKEIKLKN